MHFFERGAFCSFAEYDQGRGKRLLDPTDFKADSLHMFMMHVSGRGVEAAKVPARLKETTMRSGMIVVRFTFLDNRLREGRPKSVEVEDGYVEKAEGQSKFGFDKTNVEVDFLEGYFKDYFDGWGDLVRDEATSLMVGAASDRV
jgi:hypothetical protein